MNEGEQNIEKIGWGDALICRTCHKEVRTAKELAEHLKSEECARPEFKTFSGAIINHVKK